MVGIEQSANPHHWNLFRIILRRLSVAIITSAAFFLMAGLSTSGLPLPAAGRKGNGTRTGALASDHVAGLTAPVTTRQTMSAGVVR